MTNEIEDRRQRAREAGQDCWSTLPERRMDVAIETATQVQITREATDAFRCADVHEIKDPDFMHLRIERRLAAALTALGFEVVE